MSDSSSASAWPVAVEAVIADRIAQFYDPARVRQALESAAQTEHLRRWLCGTPAPDRTDLESFIDLLALCPAARPLIEHPKGFRQFLKLARRPRPLGAAGLEKTWRLWQAAQDLPGDSDLARLQWFRQLMQARIFLADSRRRWSLTQATGEISDLAAVVVAAAFDLAGLGPHGQIYLVPPATTPADSAAAPATANAKPNRRASSSRRRNAPLVAGSICVIGFGKLGGRELNYSSDIDLMFVFSPATQAGAGASVIATAVSNQPLARGKASDKAGRKSRKQTSLTPVPATAFDYDTVSLAAQRACQEVTRLLSDSTGDGPLYRVDLRLRPHGSTGLIAQDAEYVKRYYYSVGRVWERQALLKARPLCGDLRLGRRLFEQLYTFLYPPFTGQDLLAQIAGLKAHIETRAENDSGESGINVKTGPGGIRDIEFTVQLLQLLHAGDIADLRVPGTLEALDALERRRLLTPAEAGDLRNAYVFLRHVEHRLQAPHNRQTHKLELTEATVREVAFLMGYGDDPRAPRGPLGRFQSELSRHRREVRRIFESIFQTITAAQPDTLTALLESGEAVPAIAAELEKRLPNLPAAERQEQARILNRLTEDASSLIASRRSRDLFARVAPKLIVQFARYPDSTAGLRRFEGIVA
ncbi:MAG TPA: hypothetical protein VL860_03445, partial [Planctomycetota bacterium]|nr:hypothetical protein [Planctomycetota bacterium]